LLIKNTKKFTPLKTIKNKMKKILVIVSVLMIVFVCTALAQQKIEPSTAVAGKFGELFQGATESRWSLNDNVYGVSFRRNEESSIAYFDMNGELIANGRRISESQLPMSIADRLAETRQLQEKKHGQLGIAALYEFSRKDGTQYIATVENESITMLFVAENGRVTVSKKSNKLPAGENKSVTASSK
jgi:hypothetical protein